MMEIDKQLSGQIAQRATITTGTGLLHIWHLAFDSLNSLSQADYVEGWAVNLESYCLFEHAWLVYENRIVDPSLWQTELAYFAGVTFNAGQAQVGFATRGRLPLTHHQVTLSLNSPANSDDPAYWVAWEKATKYAEVQKRRHLLKWWQRWHELVSEQLDIVPVDSDYSL